MSHQTILLNDIERAVDSAGVEGRPFQLKDTLSADPQIMVGARIRLTPSVSVSQAPGVAANQKSPRRASKQEAKAAVFEQATAHTRSDDTVNFWLRQVESYPATWAVEKIEKYERETGHSAHSVDHCEDCKGHGKNQCKSCQGRGDHRCGGCNGSKVKRCRNCRGHGIIYCTCTNGKVWSSQHSQYVNCGTCSGWGHHGRCRACDSTGEVWCPTCNGHGALTCGTCSGKGELGCKPCASIGSIVTTYNGRTQVQSWGKFTVVEASLDDDKAALKDAKAIVEKYGAIAASDSGFKPVFKRKQLDQNGDILSFYTATVPLAATTIVYDGRTGMFSCDRIRAMGGDKTWISPPFFIDELLKPTVEQLRKVTGRNAFEAASQLRKSKFGQELMDAVVAQRKMDLSYWKGALSHIVLLGFYTEINRFLAEGLKQPIARYWVGFVFWFLVLALVSAVAFPLIIGGGRPMTDLVFPLGTRDIAEVLFSALAISGIAMVPYGIAGMKVFEVMTKKWRRKLAGGGAAVTATKAPRRAGVSIALALTLGALVIAGATLAPELGRLIYPSPISS